MNITDKIIRWTPRILGILAILFISMFAFDSFSPDKTLGQNLLSLLIHLLPSIALLIVLLIAWKRELAGGIIFIAAGIALSVFLYSGNMNRTGVPGQALLVVLILGLPFVVAGILFIISHFRQHKNPSENTI
ncbi:MAG: hypothetical protein JXR66_00960 [Bacteroidales bacterium]|nr:hypothetical protein [Bacteroidales bacterium]MBN2632094.1 hypothetical protein [Bacteroidales bacterium]